MLFFYLFGFVRMHEPSSMRSGHCCEHVFRSKYSLVTIFQNRPEVLLCKGGRLKRFQVCECLLLQNLMFIINYKIYNILENVFRGMFLDIQF